MLYCNDNEEKSRLFVIITKNPGFFIIYYLFHYYFELD